MEENGPFHIVKFIRFNRLEIMEETEHRMTEVTDVAAIIISAVSEITLENLLKAVKKVTTSHLRVSKDDFHL